MGISEANALGISAGLALSGFKPLVSSFGSFITGKHLEIRTSISYNNAPVIIVGTHGGLIGPDGATQSATQDIALMRSMPNFEVFQPCSPLETEQIIKYSINSNKPTYIRISRNEVHEIYKKNYKFKPGKIYQIKKGTKLAILSSGAILHNCLKAINDNKLKNVALFNIPSYKPFKEAAFLNRIKKFQKILVVEDHTIYGGLRSLISEIFTSKNVFKKIHYIGINDCFIESGSVPDLERKYKLSSKDIFNKIKKILN